MVKQQLQGAQGLRTHTQWNSSGAAEKLGAEGEQSNHANQNKRYHFLGSKAELLEKGAKLTFILWKLMLQLAPALEGMNLSPCLLGEDIGELEGVKVLLISAT